MRMNSLNIAAGRPGRQRGGTRARGVRAMDSPQGQRAEAISQRDLRSGDSGGSGAGHPGAGPSCLRRCAVSFACRICQLAAPLPPCCQLSCSAFELSATHRAVQVSPEQIYAFRWPIFFGAIIPIFFLSKLCTHSLYHWIEVSAPVVTRRAICARGRIGSSDAVLHDWSEINDLPHYFTTAP